MLKTTIEYSAITDHGVDVTAKLSGELARKINIELAGQLNFGRRAKETITGENLFYGFRKSGQINVDQINTDKINTKTVTIKNVDDKPVKKIITIQALVPFDDI